MLIESNKKHIASLINLWHRVFGDDEEYIKLFFRKAYFNSDTFAITVDDEVVSALYLLKAEIKCDGNTYEGRYLYAAATLPEYRGKGLMSQLIKEAAEYAAGKNFDFIALVPASDSLYNYYERFGYKEAMYKYKLTVDCDTATMRAFREIDDFKEFFDIRNSAKDNMLSYDKVTSEYAFECLRFTGNRIFSIGDKAFYAENEELFIADENVGISDMFLRNLCGENEIYSNRPLKNAVKVRNGMVYALNRGLNNKEFNMNIALD